MAFTPQLDDDYWPLGQPGPLSPSHLPDSEFDLFGTGPQSVTSRDIDQDVDLFGPGPQSVTSRDIDQDVDLFGTDPQSVTPRDTDSDDLFGPGPQSATSHPTEPYLDLFGSDPRSVATQPVQPLPEIDRSVLPLVPPPNLLQLSDPVPIIHPSDIEFNHTTTELRENNKCFTTKPKSKLMFEIRYNSSGLYNNFVFWHKRIIDKSSDLFPIAERLRLFLAIVTQNEKEDYPYNNLGLKIYYVLQPNYMFHSKFIVEKAGCKLMTHQMIAFDNSYQKFSSTPAVHSPNIRNSYFEHNKYINNLLDLCDRILAARTKCQTFSFTTYKFSSSSDSIYTWVTRHKYTVETYHHDVVSRSSSTGHKIFRIAHASCEIPNYYQQQSSEAGAFFHYSLAASPEDFKDGTVQWLNYIIHIKDHLVEKVTLGPQTIYQNDGRHIVWANILTTPFILLRLILMGRPPRTFKQFKSEIEKAKGNLHKTSPRLVSLTDNAFSKDARLSHYTEINAYTILKMHFVELCNKIK